MYCFEFEVAYKSENYHAHSDAWMDINERNNYPMSLVTERQRVNENQDIFIPSKTFFTYKLPVEFGGAEWYEGNRLPKVETTEK